MKDDNPEAKRLFKEMEELIDRVEKGQDRYLIAKMIDLFIPLPARYQAAFIEFFCEEIPNERWTKSRGDDTLYLSALRAITLHFTGLEKAKQPTLEDFITNLKAFYKSEHFKKCDVIVRKPKKAFTESLKDI